jgi:hypothetical protein
MKLSITPNTPSYTITLSFLRKQRLELLRSNSNIHIVKLISDAIIYKYNVDLVIDDCGDFINTNVNVMINNTIISSNFINIDKLSTYLWDSFGILQC